AGDVSPGIRGEEDGHGGDVLGLLPAIEGDERRDLGGGPFLVGGPSGFGLLPGPGLVDRAVQWGLDHAGAERVDPYAMTRQVLGGAVGEGDQGRLGGAVGWIGL